MLRKWEELPAEMRTKEVRPYYDSLSQKKISLAAKRVFDIVFSFLLLLLLSPAFAVIAVAIATDSPGGVFFRQNRVTQYGKVFRIHKFRTMVSGAEQLGTQVTVKNDARITKIGAFLRKYRLDELPQLIDILTGDMSFVGTRPESVHYVKMYTPEMYATLLLPAGVTSEASIKYKDEQKLLDASNNVDETYVKVVLPEKMHYNLASLRNYNFFADIGTMFKTVGAVFTS